MGPPVRVEQVTPRLLAAVMREVPVGRVRDVWRPALDRVWAFLRTQPGLRTDGHNVFLYYRPASGGDSIDAAFGVEVTRDFVGSGDVRPVRTPSGEAAIAVHVGSYDGLGQAHDAVHAWAHDAGRTLLRTSWEIYGDWNDDPTKLETQVCYLLV